MNQAKQFFLSLSKYGPAIGFINRHGMAWTYVFPVVFALLLFFFGFSAMQNVAELIKTWIGVEQWEFGAWLAWSVNVIFGVLFMVLFALLSGAIILILMSPIIAYVSEKTADILEGRSVEQGWGDFFKNLWRGLSLAVVNMVIELFFALVFFVIGFVPVLGWIIAPLGMFCVSSYFFGFSYLDYMNERAQRNVKESRLWVARHKGLAMGSGIPFGLIMLVPFAGALIGGFVCIVSAVAGTLSMHTYQQKTQALTE